MANLSKTRAVFAFTSPRTVEKIIPEIGLLISLLNGQKWNNDTQTAFFNELYNSPFYEGESRPKNPAIAARDRITRAPKALGFVDLKPVIQLTPPGEALLSGKRTHEVIARQLFKFQLPSPYHRIREDRDFNVKPYLELLRLIRVLGPISKTEMAIFFVQITNHNKFDEVVAAIKKFRNDASKNKINRKAFIDEVFTREILKIYSPEIEAKKFKTRQSADATLKKFVATKKRNHRDYADAFMRYLRATQLITFEKKTYRLIVAPSRIDEVDYLLETVDPNATEFHSEAEYKEFLFHPYSLLLLTDNRKYIEQKLTKLSAKFSPKASIEELKDQLELTERKIITSVIEKTEVSLKDYKEFDDIVSVFEQIRNKEVPDPSLYFEWNVWRALVMINYAKHVTGNFTLDLDGVPLNTAFGNMPDIEAEYEGFKMITEVTMSSGNKQYEMEGEPVARHFGRIQNKSDVPVYCLFIAPKISEGSLAYFFNTNRFKTKTYGGKTRIVPMSLDQFLIFITIAKDKGFNNPKMLESYFESLIKTNLSIEDEMLWSQHIKDSVPTWIA